MVFRTGLSVKELLDRADAVKRTQRQADVEEMKQSAKPHGTTAGENTRKSLKRNTKSIMEQKKKDAPPYRVGYSLQTW
jgi:hypothetical protein